MSEAPQSTYDGPDFEVIGSDPSSNESDPSSRGRPIGKALAALGIVAASLVVSVVTPSPAAAEEESDSRVANVSCRHGQCNDGVYIDIHSGGNVTRCYIRENTGSQEPDPAAVAGAVVEVFYNGDYPYAYHNDELSADFQGQMEDQGGVYNLNSKYGCVVTQWAQEQGPAISGTDSGESRNPVTGLTSEYRGNSDGGGGSAAQQPAPQPQVQEDAKAALVKPEPAERNPTDFRAYQCAGQGAVGFEEGRVGDTLEDGSRWVLRSGVWVLERVGTAAGMREGNPRRNNC